MNLTAKSQAPSDPDIEPSNPVAKAQQFPSVIAANYRSLQSLPEISNSRLHSH